MQVGIAVATAEWKEIAFRAAAGHFFVRQWAKIGCLLVRGLRSLRFSGRRGRVAVRHDGRRGCNIIDNALQDGDCSAERLAAVQKLRESEIRSILSMQESAAK